jgi:AraC family transcriptional regulator
MPVAAALLGDHVLSLDQVSVATYPPGATFGPRTLTDHEFVWIEEGDATWRVDGRDIPAPAGTLLLGRPGMRDEYVWDRARSTRHGFVHFRIVRRGAGLPPESAWPLACALGDDDIIRPLFRHLAWLRGRRGAEARLLEQATLLDILVRFIGGQHGSIGDGGSDASEALERVIRHIDRVWSGGLLVPIELPELARAAGVSRGHLVRLFRAQLGTTPMEALRLIRLDRAAVLLARSNLRVQEVADQTGFASPFHFSRAFRQVYRRSPRSFRNHLAAGGSLPPIRLVRVRSLSSRLR